VIDETNDEYAFRKIRELNDALERITYLEAALREIAEGKTADGYAVDAQLTARTALGR
jgi:hypothetical protein